MSKSRPLIGGAIVLYFVIGLEVLVMISPFAAFFYAAFNPFLLFLTQWPATRWLADFFLPHMVLPPGLFLKAFRVPARSSSSVARSCFCLRRPGLPPQVRAPRAGVGGFYAWIRHPQYAALAITGLGLAILWPRFLTLMLWTVMVGLYYVLARDEERRMLAAFGDQYHEYMSRTGMFFPRRAEELLGATPGPASRPVSECRLALMLIMALTVGGAFALRDYTVRGCRSGRTVGFRRWPSCRGHDHARPPDEGRASAARGGDTSPGHAGAILGYFIPTHYVMQGMIADTGPAYRLYEHHQTMSMIADWIFHPFRHLEGGAHAMMNHASDVSASPSVRRIIFLQIASSSDTDVSDPSSLFAIGAVRVPLFFIDVDLHTLTLLDVKDLGPGTGWSRVPTPMF